MKGNIFKVVIGSIFIVLFNALFFYLGGIEHTEVDWICYGFIHASYLCVLLTPLFCKSGKGLEVLSYSLYLRALFYFFTELVIGCICLVIAPENPTWPLVLQGTLLAIFLVLQMMSVLANDATIQSSQKQKEESLYLRDMVQRIRISMRDISDADIKKHLERCYDAISNSSLQSYPQAKDAEINLNNAVEVLCSAIENRDYENIEVKVKAVIYAVQDRNSIIKRCRINQQ